MSTEKARELLKLERKISKGTARVGEVVAALDKLKAQRAALLAEMGRGE